MSTRANRTIHPRPRHVLTREEFEQFCTAHYIRVLVRPPFVAVPCFCRDLNCHGWRFVESRGNALQAFD